VIFFTPRFLFLRRGVRGRIEETAGLAQHAAPLQGNGCGVLRKI
jgi:hypothetical protein